MRALSHNRYKGIHRVATSAADVTPGASVPCPIAGVGLHCIGVFDECPAKMDEGQADGSSNAPSSEESN